MNQLLKGKRGIIFGALDEQSIAWKVAECAHAEGATQTFAFVGGLRCVSSGGD
jgi:enoyl-[acyl-carrier-protein] reductase (NADH)